HEDRTMAFDVRGFIGFLGQRSERPGLLCDVFNPFECVGEENVHALAGMKLVSPGAAPKFGQMASAQFKADLEMRDSIRGHEQFKAEEAREQMFVDVSGPESGLMFSLKALADLFDHLEKECSRGGGRVKHKDAMRFMLG